MPHNEIETSSVEEVDEFLGDKGDEIFEPMRLDKYESRFYVLK